MDEAALDAQNEVEVVEQYEISDDEADEFDYDAVEAPDGRVREPRDGAGQIDGRAKVLRKAIGPPKSSRALRESVMREGE